jgi:prepilin-type N-terminal cleavage/methylation domain-containing protein
MNWPKGFRGKAGFSLVELLVVLAVGMILALASYPELARYYVRSQLEGTTQELALMMQKARYQAIKTSTLTKVCADTTLKQVSATVGTTLVSQVTLPKAITFGAPSPQTAITVTANCFVFNTDGSVAEAGSFRIVDNNSNYLELRIDSLATARVEVRKWDITDSQWYTRSQGGKAWTWNTGKLF